MPNVAPLVKEAQAASLDASSQSGRLRAGLPRAGMLVARGYGRRDWFLRRLLAVNDAVCLAVAMAVAIAASRRHAWALLAGAPAVRVDHVARLGGAVQDVRAVRAGRQAAEPRDAGRSAVAVSCPSPGLSVDVVLVRRGRAREADVCGDPRLRRPGDGAGAHWSRACARGLRSPGLARAGAADRHRPGERRADREDARQGEPASGADRDGHLRRGRGGGARAAAAGLPGGGRPAEPDGRAPRGTCGRRRRRGRGRAAAGRAARLQDGVGQGQPAAGDVQCARPLGGNRRSPGRDGARDQPAGALTLLADGQARPGPRRGRVC